MGLLNPGQSGTTGSLTVVRTCGFHDHLNPTDARFQGTIVIGSASPNPGSGY